MHQTRKRRRRLAVGLMTALALWVATDGAIAQGFGDFAMPPPERAVKPARKPPPKPAAAKPKPKPKPAVAKPKPKPRTTSAVGAGAAAGVAAGAAAPERARQPIEPKLVSITAGCFQMGSPAGEAQRDDDERQHRVCVEAFAIGKYEVTQAQWASVMGRNPSRFSGCDDCPVENVSWNDVQDYLDKLNAITGRHYRLPTEAEWEYACRSGGQAQIYCGGHTPERLAWHSNNSGGKTHPVGQKATNGLGLYDMSGNVWEWTCSVYDRGYGGAEQLCLSKKDAGSRALRGGSWDDHPAWVRSASRFGGSQEGRGVGLGFRLAQD